MIEMFMQRYPHVQIELKLMHFNEKNVLFCEKRADVIFTIHDGTVDALHIVPLKVEDHISYGALWHTDDKRRQTKSLLEIAADVFRAQGCSAWECR